jgi:FkbM family methyltransferase
VLKQLLHATIGKFGYRLVWVDKSDPTGQAAGLRPFFALLRQAGFAPRHILDVGANRGIWTRVAVEFFPDALYTLLEPQDDLKSYVKDMMDQGCRIHWVSAGAGDRSGASLFAIHRRDDSSRFISDESELKVGDERAVKVEVRTLNEIVAASGGPIPEIIKIDAEGMDLRVLEGASELLGKTDVFFVEACVFGEAENTVFEVARKMASAGYRLVDITDFNRSPKYGVVWLCELAFLRCGCSLLDEFREYA